MNKQLMEKHSIEKVQYAIDQTCGYCQERITVFTLCLLGFDGNRDMWFHFDCFWTFIKCRDAYLDDSQLSGLDSLRIEDRDKFIMKIAEVKEKRSDHPSVPSSSSKSQDQKKMTDNDYATSNKNIGFDYSRIQTIALKRENSRRNYETVQEDDETGLAKRRKLDQEQEMEKLKDQNEKMESLRQYFNKLPEREIRFILKQNAQIFDWADEDLIERLIDISLFGPPKNCMKCENGQFIYNSVLKTYICNGYTQYAKCISRHQTPLRSVFYLPDRIAKKYSPKNIPFNGLKNRCYRYEDTLSVESHIATMDSIMKQKAKEIIDPNNINIIDGIIDTNTSQTVKRGVIIDPKFNATKIHVHQDENGIYSATLVSCDILTNQNSFHRIQLFRLDCGCDFYVFQIWARIGTNLGNWSISKHKMFHVAKQTFEKAFYRMTKNEWQFRETFQKHPGYSNLIQMDQLECGRFGKYDVLPFSKTMLPVTVVKTIKKIFKMCIEFKLPMTIYDIDIHSMPLGRLSENQLVLASEVLKEIEDVIESSTAMTDSIYELSNKFYTIMPHRFGLEIADPIDSLEKVFEKRELVQGLKSYRPEPDELDNDEETPKRANRDPVDVHYDSLKYHLKPLDWNSEDVEQIREYMRNTRGSTHKISVKLIDVFELSRKDGAEEMVKKLPNRKLLWHGSVDINFSGILTEGLRIPPPEKDKYQSLRRASGHMFGKGIYFSDMFSKSVLYCQACDNEEAYILLCEVALGNTMKLYKAEEDMDLKTLKAKGYDSVHGVGEQIPRSEIVHRDGYIIPLGKPNKHSHETELKYNEFIVFETERVEPRFLVKLHVNHADHKK